LASPLSVKVFALVSQLRPAALPGPDAFSYGAAFFAAAETAWTVALQLQGDMQMQALQLEPWAYRGT